MLGRVLDNSSFMGAKDILGRLPLLARETDWPLLAYSSEVLISLKVNCYQTSPGLPPSSHYVFPEKLSDRTLLGAESRRLLAAISSVLLLLRISLGVPLRDIWPGLLLFTCKDYHHYKSTNGASCSPCSPP